MTSAERKNVAPPSSATKHSARTQVSSHTSTSSSSTPNEQGVPSGGVISTLLNPTLTGPALVPAYATRATMLMAAPPTRDAFPQTLKWM